MNMQLAKRSLHLPRKRDMRGKPKQYMKGTACNQISLERKGWFPAVLFLWFVGTISRTGSMTRAAPRKRVPKSPIMGVSAGVCRRGKSGIFRKRGSRGFFSLSLLGKTLLEEINPRDLPLRSLMKQRADQVLFSSN